MARRTPRPWHFWAALALVVIAAHLLFARSTVRFQDQFSAAVDTKWRSYRTDQYLNQLEKSPGTSREDLIPCVVAFRDHLAARQIKLRIVLRPAEEDLVSREGEPQTRPPDSSLALRDAEKRLKKAGIRTLNILPAVYRDMMAHPDRPALQADKTHFASELIRVMADTLEASLEDWQRSREGRSMLLIGDCYAFLCAENLQKGSVLPGVRCQWKNGADREMAYELSRVAPEFLQGIREVYWFLSSSTVKAGSKAPMPHPSPPDASAPPSDRVRNLHARISRLSKVPKDLAQNAPYANALALHEIIADSGEKLLIVVPVMEDRTVLTPIVWAHDQPMLLNIQPWDSAVRSKPSLAREQLFDDVQDYTTSRYYVTGWVNQP